MIFEKILSSKEVLDRIPASVKTALDTGSLHKLMAEKTGCDEGFTVEAALKDLGQKLYYKNAQWSLVRQGLDALKEL